jgi:sugar O-acyltransferase (sialic acid O-acetyltransferase NeuD family)
MEKILIIGAGGHAKVVMDMVERRGLYEIAGVLDESGAGEFFGREIPGRITDLPRLVDTGYPARGIVAVGDNFVRSRLVGEIEGLVPGFEFVSAVHPGAALARGAVIGRGAAVMPGAVVGPDAVVGEFCIVNTCASLDHDCLMREYSSLAPGARTGGNVRIGRGSALGIGAAVSHGVHIGEHSVVGAGAVVLDDLGDRVLAYGIPARTVRSREPGDKYLKSPRSD